LAKGGSELLGDPLAGELLASAIPARLAYNWADGTPRVASRWFHWDGAEFVMRTFRGAPKLRALTTGSRVALTIDANDPPNHVLSVRGTARVTMVAGVVDEYAKAATRYLGKDVAEAYVRSLPPDVPVARIAVRPEVVVLLDFGRRFPSALTSLGIAPCRSVGSLPAREWRAR
jgi:Pyridoxamine 5'-phosphate oxidase